MRSEQITLNYYKFDELSDKAKETAINNLSDINVDYNWWEFTYDDAENIGLKITSFDTDRYCEGEFTLSALEVAQNILNEHGETCETSKTAKTFLDEHAPIFADYMNENSENYESPELEDKLTELESEFLNSILEDYRIILKHEYEYLTGEESIISTIEANGYEFDINGELI